MCCFCGGNIQEAGDDPVVLNARAAQDQHDEQQTLFSHLECFKRALHPGIPIGIALHEDDDEDDISQ
jgi:hypothetical protein